MLHQVLEIDVRRTPRNHYRVQQLCAKLALVDLAGSERAAGVSCLECLLGIPSFTHLCLVQEYKFIF